MKYTLNFRIWHWLNAIIVLGLLGTVFLRKTFLSWRSNSEILMNKLLEMDVTISVDQAKVLATSIRAGMWEWHIILGYALAFSVLYRVFLYFKDDSKREKFSDLNTHKKLVRSLYYIFYASLLFMAASGLIIHFYQELHLSKELAHDIKEIHELMYNAILIFVPLHIAGVFIADGTSEKGLVSSMINGENISK